MQPWLQRHLVGSCKSVSGWGKNIVDLDFSAYGKMRTDMTYLCFRYDSLAQAATRPDGLAVLGVFFRIERGDNPEWFGLTKAIRGLFEAKTKTKNSPRVSTSLDSFLPQNRREDFYRYSGTYATSKRKDWALSSLCFCYNQWKQKPAKANDFPYEFHMCAARASNMIFNSLNIERKNQDRGLFIFGLTLIPGSLTTPGCYESVTWTVFDEAIPISEGQMTFFRGLAASEDAKGKSTPLSDNFRPIQQRNSR